MHPKARYGPPTPLPDAEQLPASPQQALLQDYPSKQLLRAETRLHAVGFQLLGDARVESVDFGLQQVVFPLYCLRISFMASVKNDEANWPRLLSMLAVKLLSFAASALAQSQPFSCCIRRRRPWAPTMIVA